MRLNKIYLGDGVYIKRDDYGNIILTTSDGIHITNCIVLKPEVLDALLVVVNALSTTKITKK